MERVKLDGAPASVKRFVRSLRIQNNGVELELDGQVLCRVVPAADFTEVEKAVLIDRAKEMIRGARQRNAGIPSRILQRDVREAVDEVRRRQR